MYNFKGRTIHNLKYILNIIRLIISRHRGSVHILPLSGDILQSVIPNISFIQYCNLLLYKLQIFILELLFYYY